jgi:hypothetical protein
MIIALMVTVLITLSPSLCLAQSVEQTAKPTATSGVAPSVTTSLSGIVVDEKDALVADASILVKDQAGKLTREGTTGRDGGFSIHELPPGSYTIVVKRVGFSTAEIRNVALTVKEQTALRIRLSVGEIGETVSILAEPLFSEKYVAPGIKLDRQAIEDLPLGGRSFQTLVLLSPGTVATRATFSEQGQLSTNGQRANSNYLMLDGVSANIGVAAGASGTGQSGAGSLPGLSVMGSTNTLVSMESLQELRVLTSTFAPEFGRTPGAQVLVSTRSGTNKFHGTAFEYFRNDALGSRDWFARPTSESGSPASSINNFGGVLGGPVFGNSTFFFASYEGLRGRLPRVASVDVPSMTARQNALPALRHYLNSFPIPNGPVRTNPVLAEFSASYVNDASFNAASLRLDHRFGDKVSIFARYNNAPSDISLRGAGSSLNNTLNLSFKTETITIGSTQVITPGLVNDVRVNYSRSEGLKDFELDDLGGAVPINGEAVFPAFASAGNSFYGFSLGGDTSFFLGKDASSFQDQFNLVENVSITKGSHQIKLGFDFRRLTSTYDQWNYREQATLEADMLALQYGTASSVAISTQDRTAINFTNLSLYAQDTWRATRRLSLTYGLRWDYNPAPSGENAQSLFTVTGLDQPRGLTLAPPGTPLYKSTYNNFAPRVGAAFMLSERPGAETKIRGGFGVFYDLGTGPLGNSASSFPYQRRQTYSNIYYPLDPSYRVNLPYDPTSPVGLIRVAQPNLELPRVLQWNVGVEQSLGATQVLTASYVGAAASRLLRTELIVNPNSNFGQVFVTTNNASANYNALQLQFQRRLSRGFQALASYTWSHSIDVASNDSSANLPSLAGYEPELDRGPSDFDVRHSFSAAITYDIPGLVKNGFGKTLLRNWTIESIVSARTAAPLEIFSSRDSNFGPFNLRPDLVAGASLYVSDPTAPGGRRLNPQAFVIPTELRQGNLGRNVLRGFPFSQVDVALHRSFALFESVKLQFKMEVFNVFNHPNFADPIGDLNNSQFGLSPAMLGRGLTTSSNTGFNPMFQAGGPRAIQFALKLQF